MRGTRILLSMMLLLPALLPRWLMAQDDNPPLWQVSSAGQQGHLLGSIHFGSHELYPLPAVVEDAYAQSDMLVVELDLTQVDVAKASQLIMRKGMYQTLTDNLSQRLDGADWELLNHVGNALGLPIEYLQQQKPWTVVLTLSRQLYLHMGFKEHLGVDRHFLDQAHADSKPVIELESFEEQIGFFDRFDEAEQLLLLRETLLEFDQAEALVADMVRFWRAGASDKLEQLINGSFLGKPELSHVYEVLLSERNIKMAATIHALLEQGKTPFVVVGAGHLLGTDSIVELLRQQGYRVERL